MKEHESHKTPEHTIIENYKEEGAATIETIDIANHESHPHRAHKKSGWTLTTPFAVIIGSIIIAGGLMGYGAITRGGNQAPTTPFTGRPVDPTDFVSGNKKSDVILVEYSDPECPFCVQAHESIKKIRNDYANKIAFTYRYFPLTQIHPHAIDESKAIFCAGKVGGEKKHFEYIDALFDYKLTNKTTQLSATGKEDFARQIGLDTQAFTSCLTSKEALDTINASTNDGIAAGVQGTPASFVLLKTRSGYKTVSMIDGARPYEYFKTVIDEALSR